MCRGLGKVLGESGGALVCSVLRLTFRVSIFVLHHARRVLRVRVLWWMRVVCSIGGVGLGDLAGLHDVAAETVAFFELMRFVLSQKAGQTGPSR